jgi:hypothetical protein
METQEDGWIVSEDILSDETFGAYLIPSDNKDVEMYFTGGHESPQAARGQARELFQRLGASKEEVARLELQYRKRQPPTVASIYHTLSLDQLKSAVSSHIDDSLRKLNKKEIFRSILSPENVMSIASLLSIWILWTGHSIKIPKVELPVLGSSLSGVVADQKVVAVWLVPTLFVLQLALFFDALKRNASYDLLRKQALALVIKCGWRSEDFAKLFAVQAEKSSMAWFVRIVEWLHDADPRSLTNLARTGVASSKVEKIADDLGQKLRHDLSEEFNRRVHNLYYLEFEKDYGAFYISFDPLLYLISPNRVAYRMYTFLQEKGVRVDTANAPTDPYLVERISRPAFWIGVILRVLFVGGVGIWSLSLIKADHPMLWVNVAALVLMLFLPNWWNYRVVVKRVGYPRGEPLGAYTVGPLTPNRLSLV